MNEHIYELTSRRTHQVFPKATLTPPKSRIRRGGLSQFLPLASLVQVVLPKCPLFEIFYNDNHLSYSDCFRNQSANHTSIVANEDQSVQLDDAEA
jgi:hypothetical protein